MVYKLLQIDELNIELHPYLVLDVDKCYYVMDYTSGQGYEFSEANSKIHNFKKSVERKGKGDYQYKGVAIKSIAKIFRDLFSKKILNEWTFIPIPPSKCKNDPLYDDRVVQLVDQICNETDSDIRELIIMKETMESSHGSGARATVDEIYANLKIDKTLKNPAPTKVILFDDVITAGAHFKACKKILLETFPGIEEIRGVFIARRVFLPDEETDGFQE